MIWFANSRLPVAARVFVLLPPFAQLLCHQVDQVKSNADLRDNDQNGPEFHHMSFQAVLLGVQSDCDQVGKGHSDALNRAYRATQQLRRNRIHRIKLKAGSLLDDSLKFVVHNHRLIGLQWCATR